MVGWPEFIMMMLVRRPRREDSTSFGSMTWRKYQDRSKRRAAKKTIVNSHQEEGTSGNFPIFPMAGQSCLQRHTLAYGGPAVQWRRLVVLYDSEGVSNIT